MTTIYLISNGLVLKNINYETDETLETKREKRILSIEGEARSKELVKNPFLNKVNKIYTSNYVVSMETAKYLANSLELEINVYKELKERTLGFLKDKRISMVNEMQENDFDYRLDGGESLNDVKRRMLKFLKTVLVNDENQTIAIFTHNVALTGLLSEFCTKGFNLDNRLILNYNDNVIIDGQSEDLKIIELVFDKTDLVSIKRKN